MSQQNDAIEVRSYNGLVAALRARADELEITRDTIDAAGGLPIGYTAKLFGSSQVKYIGGISLGAILGVLGLKLIVARDSTTQIPDMPRRKRARVKP